MSASTSALVWTIAMVMLPFLVGAYRLTEVGDGQVEPGMVSIRAYIGASFLPLPWSETILIGGPGRRTPALSIQDPLSLLHYWRVAPVQKEGR